MTWLLVGGCVIFAVCMLRIIGGERTRRLAELEQRAREAHAAHEARLRAASEVPTVR